jgi:hypothetical protein
MDHDLYSLAEFLMSFEEIKTGLQNSIVKVDNTSIFVKISNSMQPKASYTDNVHILSFNNSNITHVEDTWLVVVIIIREIPGSNLGFDIGCPY